MWEKGFAHTYFFSHTDHNSLWSKLNKTNKMKTQIQTSIKVVEGCIGYNAVKYIPRNIALGRFNGMALGSVVAIAGYFMPSKVGNHVIATGIGATIGGVLDAFGLKR